VRVGGGSGKLEPKGRRSVVAGGAKVVEGERRSGELAYGIGPFAASSRGEGGVREVSNRGEGGGLRVFVLEGGGDIFEGPLSKSAVGPRRIGSGGGGGDVTLEGGNPSWLCKFGERELCRGGGGSAERRDGL
jgi:hypothetical protein